MNLVGRIALYIRTRENCIIEHVYPGLRKVAIRLPNSAIQLLNYKELEIDGLNMEDFERVN